MISDTINKVLAAETDANEQLSLARSRASKIVSSAEDYSKAALEKKLSDAQSECASIETDYKKKISAFQNEIREKCSAENSRIKNLSEKNMTNAADSIISSFFSSDSC